MAAVWLHVVTMRRCAPWSEPPAVLRAVITVRAMGRAAQIERTVLALLQVRSSAFCHRQRSAACLACSTEHGASLVCIMRHRTWHATCNVASMQHPNIVKLHCSFMDSSKLYLVLDLAPTDLRKLLQSYGTFA
jgi:hypothetical protein